MERSLSVVIKPTLACNMGCRHCYHPPDERRPGTVSTDDLRRLFEMVARDYESAWFIWHGGEPLLLPLSFYRKAVALQEGAFGEHRFGNTIQTNGLSIGRPFMRFCADKGVNVGVSHEGPCARILRTRCAEVEGTIGRMSKKGGVFSVSSTVSRGAQGRQREIYEHFRGIGAAVTLSPVIAAGCAAEDPSLVPDPDAYAASSIEAFEAWLNDRDAEAPLAPHYLYVLSALGDPVPSDCAHDSCLTKWICMYPNGDLYPCAKACPRSMRLCNIRDIASVREAFEREAFEGILRASIERRGKCAQCPVYRYCQGGCFMDAYYQGGMENNGGDACRVYRAVFSHVKGAVDAIVSEERDLSQYNRFVREAVIGKLVNPMAGRPGP